MAKLSVAERLKVGLEEAAANADVLKIPSRQAAKEFYDERADLIEPFIESWVIEKLAAIIGGHRAAIRHAANPQLVFEGVLGFKHLPAKIELKDGSKVARAKATIGELRLLASQLGQKETPAQREVHQAIELMSKYTAAKKQITWAEVVEAEAKKAGAK